MGYTEIGALYPNLMGELWSVKWEYNRELSTEN